MTSLYIGGGMPAATQALTLFYRQVALRGGLPFDVVIPNATTRKTFEATDAGRDLVVCRDAKEMFDKLGIRRLAPGRVHEIGSRTSQATW